MLEPLDEIRHHSKFCEASIIKLIVKVAPCSPIIIEIKIAEWVARSAQSFNIMLNCIHARKEGLTPLSIQMEENNKTMGG